MSDQSSNRPLTSKAVTYKALGGPADPFVTKPVLQHFADLYVQGADPTNPAASPLYGPVPGTTTPLRIDVGAFLQGCLLRTHAAAKAKRQSL